MIEAYHNCIQLRGVRHFGTSMKTSTLTGEFIETDKTKRFYKDLNITLRILIKIKTITV